MKTLIVFDLDGTLAESKTSIDTEMADLLNCLLGLVKVSVISGGAWPQFQAQLLAGMRHDTGLKNLFLLPTCGTKFYRYGTDWERIYSEDFTEAEKSRIIEALRKSTASTKSKSGQVWGDVIEDRGSQITFSALGQEAPLDEKRKWDPDYSKRKKIKLELDRLIPQFAVNIGGSTSIDVTKPGIDKAYGIRKLRDILHIPIKDMIFIGDALFPGGNDYPAKQAGAYSIQVTDPRETKRVIETILGCLGEGG
jgi:phosphomannomutase